jgi:ATP-dependent DNA helicase RecG
LSFPGPIPPVDAQILSEKKRIVARDYRNRRVGDLLKELHLTEGRGTGIPTMREAMKNNGSPEPLLETDKQCTYFLTTLHVHPDWLEKDGIDRVNTEQVVNKDWTSGEQVPENIETLVKTIEGEMPRNTLQELVNIKSRRYFIEEYLDPSLEKGLIERTIPDKPNSSKQRYRLTEKGKALKKELDQKTH